MKESNKQFDDVKATLHTEALKLADELDATKVNGNKIGGMVKASAMIRRLVEELDKLKDMLAKHQDIIADWDKKEYRRTHEGFSTIIDKVTPQTKPLSDEEIGDCVDDYFGLMALQHKYIYDIDQVQEYGLKLARAIEERHGIK